MNPPRETVHATGTQPAKDVPAEVRDNEQRLSALIQATTAVLWTADAQGGFLVPQPSWENYTGQRWPEYAGTGGLAAIHPEDRRRVEEAWLAGVRSSQPYQVEARLWHAAGGQYRHTVCRAAPVRNPDYSIREWVGTFEDVHQRWLAEENLRQSNAALRESEDHFRSTVELNPQIPWTATPEGKLEDFSPQWLALTGLTREQAFRGGWLQAPHPEDLPGLREQWAHSIRTGDPFDFEHRLRQADGSYRWMRTRARPRRDSKGKIVRWYAYTEDIDDRKRAEIELRRAKRQVDNILASIRESFIALDHQWRFTYVSDRVLAQTEKNREQLIGQKLWDVFPEARESGFWDGYHRCMHERVPLQFETTYPDMGRSFEVHAYPTDEGICAYILDITDRKQNEDALRKANAELEEFAHVASHDLQEPLRAVHIFTELLLKRFPVEDADASLYGGFIRQAVVRMVDLIRDLLSYSKIIHADRSLRSTAELSSSLAQALQALQARIDETGAIVTSDPLPVVLGDSALLSQVFQNLLSNSLKYRRDPLAPQIHIAAEPEREHWVIAVRDNGIGFEQQYAERIFRLFQRLHRDQYPGTGLGLAICQRIVQRCGGRMWAEGRPGQGATFFFSLPKAEGSGAASSL